MPCFVDEPDELIAQAVAAEDAGWDGWFLWDHLTWTDAEAGLPVVDPWVVLGAVAAATSRIRIGTMITPLSRRRPAKLARETTTVDRLSGGRLILGVGLGSPPYGDFARFGDEADATLRARILDESLTVLNGLWSGERFTFDGEHHQVGATTFTPTPVQRPRIPVWVGGVLPNAAPLRRAARWDGSVPVAFSADRTLVTPTPEQIGSMRAVTGRDDEEFDVAVWADVADDPSEVAAVVPGYARAGATWYIETARPVGDWFAGLERRIEQGPPR